MILLLCSYFILLRNVNLLVLLQMEIYESTTSFPLLFQPLGQSYISLLLWSDGQLFV